MSHIKSRKHTFSRAASPNSLTAASLVAGLALGAPMAASAQATGGPAADRTRIVRASAALSEQSLSATLWTIDAPTRSRKASRACRSLRSACPAGTNRSSPNQNSTSDQSAACASIRHLKQSSAERESQQRQIRRAGIEVVLDDALDVRLELKSRPLAGLDLLGHVVDVQVQLLGRVARDVDANGLALLGGDVLDHPDEDAVRPESMMIDPAAEDRGLGVSEARRALAIEMPTFGEAQGSLGAVREHRSEMRLIAANELFPRHCKEGVENVPLADPAKAAIVSVRATRAALPTSSTCSDSAVRDTAANSTVIGERAGPPRPPPGAPAAASPSPRDAPARPA